MTFNLGIYSNDDAKIVAETLSLNNQILLDVKEEVLRDHSRPFLFRSGVATDIVTGLKLSPFLAYLQTIFYCTD
ncbi:hypothetical protein VZ94_10030 [Methylocucumis oryzae]|uniref:Uncharacterized protein n=1 Tax=Methylocucumis oryzae TaxID=1632867 RepID=A0A0F3IIT2_9GAMM|nr:hypothetical protein VZ94_10030 [Methylocucumis oryzae]